MQATDALLKLAVQFQDRGCYPQAAHCLQAVVGSNALPATVATAHLLLGQLLLDHTHDLAQAREHLNAAELTLRSSPSAHLLRCEALDTLARCYQMQGMVQQQWDAYTRGLTVCREGTQSKDREALARWAVYFHFKIADCSLLRDSAEAALKALQGVAQLPSLTPTEQVLHQLARAFLYLHACKYDSALVDLGAARDLLDALPDQDGVQAQQLRAHMLVLGAAVTLARGALMDLCLDDPPRPDAMLTQLERLLEGLGGQEWSYGWVPAAQVAAVAAVLQGAALRSTGKNSPALEYIERAERLVEAALREHHFALQGTEGALNPHSVWSARGWALLRLLLVEQRALLALVTSEFAEAAEQIGILIGVLQRFPTLLRGFVPEVQMLQGFYAQSLAEYGPAISHFRAVLDCETCPTLHTMAAITAALCELQADSTKAGLGRAVELLEGVGGPDQSVTTSTGGSGVVGGDGATPVDKTLRLLVDARVQLRQGDSAGAKVALARALKLVHSQVGNSQLVGAVLTALAPVQLGMRDTSGAAALLDAAWTILKGISDLPNVVASLNSMAALHERLKDEERLGRTRDYIKRRMAELLGKQQDARGATAHQLVLHWAPMQE